MAVEVAPGNLVVTEPNYSDRFIVRSPAGIPYVVLKAELSSGVEKIQVYKGDAITPTSFATQDYAHAFTTVWTTTDVPWIPNCAIDSTGVIHIIFLGKAGTTPYLKYITFDTSTDLFGSVATISSNTGESIPNMSQLAWSEIAIDSNDIPHIVYGAMKKVGGTTYKTVMYNNRIGGAWNAAGIAVRGAPDGYNCYAATITIDQDNKPFIACANYDINAFYIYHDLCLGNANDATTFTINTVGHCWSARYALGVDKDGNHYCGFDQGTGVGISFIKHTKGGSWATWTAESNGYSGYNSADGIGMAVDGSNVYVFYQKSSGPDAWDSYKGSWIGESFGPGDGYGRYCKWGEWVDFDSLGINRGLGGSNVGGRTEIDCAYSTGSGIYFTTLSLVAVEPNEVLMMGMC